MLAGAEHLSYRFQGDCAATTCPPRKPKQLLNLSSHDSLMRLQIKKFNQSHKAFKEILMMISVSRQFRSFGHLVPTWQGLIGKYHKDRMVQPATVSQKSQK